MATTSSASATKTGGTANAPGADGFPTAADGSPRLPVHKTYKLLIDGGMPRSESGRSTPVRDPNRKVVGHVCRASRKDLRNAVSAARRALPGWSARSAYNRGQILYRLAEMVEGKREELITHTVASYPMPTPRNKKAVAKLPMAEQRRIAAREIDAAVDRLIAYAGWCDKFGQVLGTHNAVNGPYYNFTVPEATGVTAVVAPDAPGVLGMVSLMAPVLCAGGTVVALASQQHPIVASVFGEAVLTSDVPAGVVNILTGVRMELAEHIGLHRDIDAIHAADVRAEITDILKRGTADNLKRITVREMDAEEWYDDARCASPWWIEPFVEMKTIWHPAGT
jgi:acyl-CoA reductase-like NAD-dependent aldehyde dehydrogenase